VYVRRKKAPKEQKQFDKALKPSSLASRDHPAAVYHPHNPFKCRVELNLRNNCATGDFFLAIHSRVVARYNLRQEKRPMIKNAHNSMRRQSAPSLVLDSRLGVVCFCS
jgi:hypothetical protein